MRASGSLLKGLHAAGLANNYRPFGIYAMSTSSGVAYFEEPSELLQLLVLTVEASTSPIHKGADVLREHSMARHDAAAQRIDPAAPTWRGASAIFSDARSMSELGILKLLQDILQHGAQDKEEVMAHADSLTMQQTQQIMDAVQAMQREPEPGSLQSARSHNQLLTATVSSEQQLANYRQRQEAHQVAAAALAKLRRYLLNKDSLGICERAEMQPGSFNDAEISMADDI
ncbi:TPA: hypothetical protein ACH3X3_010100 [Trebouxia sp. C0006]